MKIKRVNVRNTSSISGVTDITFDMDGGNCNLAFVPVFHVTGGSDNVTSITYGGDTMSRYKRSSVMGNLIIYGFEGCKPGVQEVVITLSDTSPIRYGCTTYIGAHATATIPDVTGQGNISFPNSGVLDVSVTTTRDNCILFGWGTYSGSAASAISSGTNATEISIWDGSGSSAGMFESNPLDTGAAGSKTFGVDCASNQTMDFIVVAITPNLSNPNFFRKP